MAASLATAYDATSQSERSIQIPSARCTCERWLAFFIDSRPCVRTVNIIIVCLVFPSGNSFSFIFHCKSIIWGESSIIWGQTVQVANVQREKWRKVQIFGLLVNRHAHSYELYRQLVTRPWKYNGQLVTEISLWRVDRFPFSLHLLSVKLHVHVTSRTTTSSDSLY